MIRASMFWGSALLAGVVLFACSSDDGAPAVVEDAGVDAATPNDATTPQEDAATEDAAKIDAGGDAGASSVRCTKADFDAHDHTGTNGVDITFPLVATPEQYMNNCARVKVGQHVGIYGDFVSHPIEPKGGDTPSFIPAKSTGDALNLTAPTAGVYGFQCTMHPTTMFGAVEVVP